MSLDPAAQRTSLLASVLHLGLLGEGDEPRAAALTRRIQRDVGDRPARRPVRRHAAVRRPGDERGGPDALGPDDRRGARAVRAPGGDDARRRRRGHALPLHDPAPARRPRRRPRRAPGTGAALAAAFVGWYPFPAGSPHGAGILEIGDERFLVAQGEGEGAAAIAEAVAGRPQSVLSRLRAICRRCDTWRTLGWPRDRRSRRTRPALPAPDRRGRRRRRARAARRGRARRHAGRGPPPRRLPRDRAPLVRHARRADGSRSSSTSPPSSARRPRRRPAARATTARSTSSGGSPTASAAYAPLNLAAGREPGVVLRLVLAEDGPVHAEVVEALTRLLAETRTPKEMAADRATRSTSSARTAIALHWATIAAGGRPDPRRYERLGRALLADAERR